MTQAETMIQQLPNALEEGQCLTQKEGLSIIESDLSSLVVATATKTNPSSYSFDHNTTTTSHNGGTTTTTPMSILVIRVVISHPN
jgi:hypothetical protein